MTDQQRYDRQLRLWGEAAQSRLEQTRLLFIGSDCLATESLKSIVLPGIGHITIADNTTIDDYDLETNFFIEISDKGKQRGEIVLKNILELNDRVTGEFVNKSFEEIMKEKEFLKQFNLIVCSNQIHEQVVEFSKESHCPLFEVATNGYYGYVKGYFKSHVIFDIGKDDVHMDLRIIDYAPKIQEYYESFDLKSLSNDVHKHIPFPIILYHILKQWQQEKGHKKLPKTSAEKKEVRELIKKEQRSYIEENFMEANKRLFYTWQKEEGHVERLLADERATKSVKGLSKDEIEFWTFIHGVKVFKEKHGRTPINSTLKDMICGNEEFTSMQKVFNEQLNEDANEILSIVQEKIKQDGTTEDVSFDLEKIKGHCKTLVKMNQYDGVDGTVNQTWNEEHSFKFEKADEEDELSNDAKVLCSLASFLAVFEFFKKHGHYPVEEHVDEMMMLTQDVLKKKEIEHEIERVYVEEICRFGGVQIHSTCSIIGSFVAQTIIHFATHKFAGLNNTYFFDTTTGFSVAGKL